MSSQPKSSDSFAEFNNQAAAFEYDPVRNEWKHTAAYTAYLRRHSATAPSQSSESTHETEDVVPDFVFITQTASNSSSTSSTMPRLPSSSPLLQPTLSRYTELAGFAERLDQQEARLDRQEAMHQREIVNLQREIEQLQGTVSSLQPLVQDCITTLTLRLDTNAVHERMKAKLDQMSHLLQHPGTKVSFPDMSNNT